ncbi:MAG TPA: RluA family pseudouridine synthase [Ignavibacteria bacterium]|jgi:23S rRNA pseudouridine1911/1915/1917 synthase
MMLEIPKGQTAKIRIDKYLATHVENSSRTKVKEVITEGGVLVNGKKIKANYIIQPNDVIDITLPDAPERVDVVPENIPLDIMFEDEYLMIINKPAGMVTHPAYKNYSGTLVNALLYHVGNKLLPTADGDEEAGLERAGIVHRLDKLTSGIIVAAKDEVTQRKLSMLFSRHEIEREYWALVWGLFKQKKGIIEKALGRDPRDRRFFAVVKEGKHSVTEYEVIKEYDFLSLIKLKLHTGRTHQIRVHMFSIGHPVFGDPIYEGRKAHGIQLTTNLKQRIKNLLDTMPRQALHAKVLGFTHPITVEKLRFESELPEDMNAVIEKL